MGLEKVIKILYRCKKASVHFRRIHTFVAETTHIGIIIFCFIYGIHKRELRGIKKCRYANVIIKNKIHSERVKSISVNVRRTWTKRCRKHIICRSEQKSIPYRIIPFEKVSILNSFN